MRLSLPAVIATAFLSLSACIETEMTMTIESSTEASMNGFIQVQRAMYEMSGGNEEFCPAVDGGTVTLTDTHARCDLSMRGPFAEFMQGDPGQAPTIVDLKDGTVRVSFPVNEMTGEMGEMGSDPAMLAMFRPMLEGGHILLRVSGAQIMSSTGTISADGRSAEIAFSLTDLIDNPDAIPNEFVSVVRY